MYINKIVIDKYYFSSIETVYTKLKFLDEFKYILSYDSDYAYFYNTLNKNNKKDFIKELKDDGVFIKEDKVNIYSNEGYLCALDHLYEESISNVFFINNKFQSIILN